MTTLPPAEIGSPFRNIDTPALIVDLDAFERNLETMAAAAGRLGVRLRPHAKTHKSPIIASKQIARGAVEALGIERSFQAMADADLTLVVIDASAAPDAEDRGLIERARSAGPALVAANKSDLPRSVAPLPEAILVSALSGDGIERLRQAILDAVAPAGALAPETGFLTSLRHEQLLRECERWLGKARAAVGAAIPHEMLLLDLYAALQPIDAITGGTTADDILNRIFSTFCIGK